VAAFSKISANGTGRSPWAKYEDNPILLHYGDLAGTGHHSLFKDKKGRLRIVFHAHFSQKRVHPRHMYIATVKVSRKGLYIADKPMIIPRLED